jgi:hypothetical protein
MESRCEVRRSERRFTNSLKRSRIPSSIGQPQTILPYLKKKRKSDGKCEEVMGEQCLS